MQKGLDAICVMLKAEVDSSCKPSAMLDSCLRQPTLVIAFFRLLVSRSLGPSTSLSLFPWDLWAASILTESLRLMTPAKQLGRIAGPTLRHRASLDTLESSVYAVSRVLHPSPCLAFILINYRWNKSSVMLFLDFSVRSNGQCLQKPR